MTSRGLLGLLPATAAGGAAAPVAGSALFSPLSILAEDDAADRVAVEAQAQAIADSGLARLTAIAIQNLKRSHAEQSAVDHVVYEHGDMLLQAAAFAIECEVMNGFLAAAGSDEIRQRNGALPHVDPKRRNAIAIDFIHRFHAGAGRLIAELARGGAALGVN